MRKYRIGRKRYRPRPVRFAILVVILIAVIVSSIIFVVHRQKADAQATMGRLAEQAELEHLVSVGQVDCFVVLDSVGTPEASAEMEKHYPCTSVPIAYHEAGDPYWTAITIGGVPAEAATSKNIQLFCASNGRSTGSSTEVGPSKETDLTAFVAGMAGGKDQAPHSIDCEIRAEHGVIRTVHVAMVLDASHTFGG